MNDAKNVNLSAPEPAPVRTDGQPIWEMVVADMQTRDRAGREKYGTPLQAHNGRRPLIDAYQEALDLVVYLRQELAERESDSALVDAHMKSLGRMISAVIWMSGASDFRPGGEAHLYYFNIIRPHLSEAMRVFGELGGDFVSDIAHSMWEPR